MSSSNIILDVKGVTKTFGGLKALTDVNLEVEEGKIHAIIGPNGAGKSTLLNCLIGLLEVDSGSVTFAGQPLIGVSPHEIIQRGIARVFQTPQIFPGMDCQHNVAIAILAHRDGMFKLNPQETLNASHPVMQEAMVYLEKVGLQDHRAIVSEHLSRGDKRRLELAVCLSAQPRLLLLDEPTAGMARHDTNRTIDLLKEISQSGMTKIVIEHDMHVVFSLAEKITVLAQGMIVTTGEPDEVRGDPRVEEAYLGGSHYEFDDE